MLIHCYRWNSCVTSQMQDNTEKGLYMKKIGIYKITNKINNKVYIGQSKNISRRWREHKRHYKNKNNSSVLYKAIRKYGLENFLFEIIELCDESKLDELEIKYIANYKSNNKNYGYNLTEGGDSPPRLKMKTIQILN